MKDIGEKIKSYLSIIITIIVLFAIVAIATVAIGVRSDGLTVDFWITSGIGFALQFSMVIVWLPEGKKYGQRNEKYIALQKATNVKVEEVTVPEMIKPLDDFCREATLLNRRAYVARKAAQKYGVNYELWLDQTEAGQIYRAKFSETVARFVRKMEIRAESAVAEIKSTQISSGTHIKEVFDIENYEQSIGAVKVTIKLIYSIVSSIVPALLTFSFKEPIESIIVKMIWWFFAMGTTIFFSLRNGINLVTVVRADYLRRIIDFLDRFDAWRIGNDGTNACTKK